jgi:hypothetical protein
MSARAEHPRVAAERPAQVVQKTPGAMQPTRQIVERRMDRPKRAQQIRERVRVGARERAAAPARPVEGAPAVRSAREEVSTRDPQGTEATPVPTFRRVAPRVPADRPMSRPVVAPGPT